jgi:hypothetical protein
MDEPELALILKRHDHWRLSPGIFHTVRKLVRLRHSIARHGASLLPQ